MPIAGPETVKGIQTRKIIDIVITNYVAVMKALGKKCKSTESRAKDEFEKKVEWFKENWMFEKANQNHKISHLAIS